jgi:quercetin dioxygenase-like cupin family protein
MLLRLIVILNQGGTNMLWNTVKIGITLAAVVTVAGLNLQTGWADEYKPKAEVKTLVQGPLAGVEGKEVIVKHFTLPPGHVGGRHFHPGPVFVYVLEGALDIETGGKVQTVRAGELYQEPLRQVMQARNTSTSEGVKLVVFQVGDAGKPMMVKAD